MEREQIHRWNYKLELSEAERDDMLWALLEYMGLEVYRVKYDGCAPEFEFKKTW